MFVLPVYRDDDSVNVPLAVVSLMFVTSFLWIVTSIWAFPQTLFAHYGFIPAQGRISTAFTSMFLHVGFWHVAGNMWFLWMFGRRVENSVGFWLFTLIYMASGLGGTLLHWMFNRRSAIPCVSASGAISGIVGCFFVLFPRADFDLDIYLGWWRVKRIGSHTTAAVGTWIAEQTILGFLSQAVYFSSVAFWGHVGGFIVGLFAALAFKNTVALDDDGFPTQRSWFYNSEVMSKVDITRLDLH